MRCLPALLLGVGLLAAALQLHARTASPAISPLANPGMETDADNDNWPDGWPVSAGATWENDGGNHHLRLTSPRAGSLVTLPCDIALPAGTGSIELAWRQRVTGLAPGAQKGDARVAVEFFDESQAKIPADTAQQRHGADTDGWINQSATFAVPAAARSLRFTPALVRVAAGTLDIDDLALTTKAGPPSVAPPPAKQPVAQTAIAPQSAPPATPAPAAGTEPEQRQNWPSEIRVSGNRLVNKAGKEVWLQGVNVPSLEWSVRGEKIDRSVVAAIEQWKANVIRLPVKGDHWFGRGTKHNTQTDGGAAYRAVVDQAITIAANRGAYVVLDLHHYRASRASDLEFWTDAATRYKNHPAVIFDLLNEPHGTTWDAWQKGGFIEEKKKNGDEDNFLTEAEKRENKRGFDSPGMQKMLDTVRATGARNVVVAGGLDYAYSLTGILEGNALKDTAGNGVMYATHVYPWKKGWQKRFLDVAAKHPILVGEVGGDAKKMTWLPANSQEDVATFAPAIIGVIQKHRLNWTGWSFHPKASPRMILDWDYTPTPFWGQLAKDAFSGKQFPFPEKVR